MRLCDGCLSERAGQGARAQASSRFVCFSVSIYKCSVVIFFCSQLLQATLSTSPSKPWWSFRVSGMKYVLAFFDFTSFGVQCTNKNAQQFITNQYFLGIDFLKNIGTGACFLSLKIIGKSEMSNFDSAILKSQKSCIGLFGVEFLPLITTVDRLGPSKS